MYSGLKSAMPPSLMLTLAHVLRMYVFVSGERCMDDLFEDSGPQRCGGQRTLVTLSSPWWLCVVEQQVDRLIRTDQ